ncbi:hypothetical protein B6U83_03370 [Thermoplasmatales archaeon ex4484_36]|nr:MAG: hypothetical protein B6U83_03370 [Thermoplasmatales archaeon ex4484_36]
MINRGVVPLVYEKGSVGTSGDLSPMSQIAEVVLGEGKAFYKGELLPGGEAMRRAGLKPIEPYYKEGLALINGPQMMAGQAALILCEVRELLKNALITSSMSIDTLRAVKKAFDPRVHKLRGHPGQILVAEVIRRLTEGSETIGTIKGRVHARSINRALLYGEGMGGEGTKCTLRQPYFYTGGRRTPGRWKLPRAERWDRNGHASHWCVGGGEPS